MFSLRQTIDKFQKIRDTNIYDVSADVSAEHSDTLMDMNRDQLLYGRNAAGELLTPGYLDDPFFETPAAAKAYYNKKVRLTSAHWTRFSTRFYFRIQLFPDKPPDTPNLLINGNWFFNHFFININAGSHSYVIGSTGEAAADIEGKYGKKVYGLAEKSRAFFFREFISQEWKLRTGIGVKSR
jgi:hypothetical protein